MGWGGETGARRKTRSPPPRPGGGGKLAPRPPARRVPPSGGAPYTLAFDHESRRSGCPVGIESGTLETTTFQTAVDAETLSASQRRCAAPSMVLPGPSSAVLGLRY